MIDGNNLLFAARAVGTSPLLLGRSMLCDTLAAWSRKENQRVHVVFDGPVPKGGHAEQIGNRDIEVTFSGRGVSADSVLSELVELDSAARRLVVVSSDREVARAARRRGASAMRSEDFWKRVERDLARPGPPPSSEPAEKTHGLADGAEAWLAEFGLEADGSDDWLRQRGVEVDDPDRPPARD